MSDGSEGKEETPLPPVKDKRFRLVVLLELLGDSLRPAMKSLARKLRATGPLLQSEGPGGADATSALRSALPCVCFR